MKNLIESWYFGFLVVLASLLTGTAVYLAFSNPPPLRQPTVQELTLKVESLVIKTDLLVAETQALLRQSN
jgi:hypothetical protein